MDKRRKIGREFLSPEGKPLSVREFREHFRKYRREEDLDLVRNAMGIAETLQAFPNLRNGMDEAKWRAFQDSTDATIDGSLASVVLVEDKPLSQSARDQLSSFIAVAAKASPQELIFVSRQATEIKTISAAFKKTSQAEPKSQCHCGRFWLKWQNRQ